MSNLYVIPTPIGNINDITKRAVLALTHCEFILCEDTRTTFNLLKLLEIDTASKKLLAYHDHNERQKLAAVIEILNNGQDVALVSDAGMPLLSDPGFPLVREIRANYPEINVEVLPGPTSITTALVAAGMPTDKFAFFGYLPRKSGERQRFFEKIQQVNELISQSYIVFESPHRIIKSLEDFQLVYGENQKVALCRELTKKYESVAIDSVSSILNKIQSSEITTKGEIVLVFNLDL